MGNMRASDAVMKKIKNCAVWAVNCEESTLYV
jgi:hypothetical protein